MVFKDLCKVLLLRFGLNLVLISWGMSSEHLGDLPITVKSSTVQDSPSATPQKVHLKRSDRLPLVVVGVASPDEREIAEQLISLRQHLPTLEAQARHHGFQIIHREDTVYLLPPRLYRDIPPHLVTELAILLQQLPPRSPRSIAELPSRLRSLIHRWLISEKNPSRPSQTGEIVSLLSAGYYWWSGMLNYQIEVDNRTLSGGFFLEIALSEALPKHSPLSGAAPSALPETQLLEQSSLSLQESVLFSDALPLNERVVHAKVFWEIVEQAYKQGYEEYRRAIGALQSLLAQQYRLPLTGDEKEVLLGQLPEEIQTRIAEAVQRDFLPNLSLPEVRNQLGGAPVKIELVPIVLVGGFVDELNFQSYGWGVSDLLKF